MLLFEWAQRLTFQAENLIFQKDSRYPEQCVYIPYKYLLGDMNRLRSQRQHGLYYEVSCKLVLGSLKESRGG